ncbi:MAG: GntR family transcriptional regulator [Pusillimonas sp.]|nr:MAG: GntR family transcriptional regulator [Pusillimonas sp.]
MYSTKIPITYQLAQLLRAEITRGTYPPGAKIPTELQLVENYSVSVITVQRALRELENEGLIERHRGRGTFVRKDISALVMNPQSALELMFSDEFETGTEIIEKKLVNTPEHLRQRFESDKVYEICRVARTDGRPWSYSVHYVLPEFGKQMTLAQLRRYPMFRILREQFGLDLRNVEINLESVTPPMQISRLLEIDPLAPVLFFRGALFAIDGRLVHTPEIWFRGDRFQFRFDMDLTQDRTKSDVARVIPRTR